MFPLSPEQIQMLKRRFKTTWQKIILLAQPFNSWQSALKAFWRREHCNEYLSMDLLTFMDLLHSIFNLLTCGLVWFLALKQFDSIFF